MANTTCVTVGNTCSEAYGMCHESAEPVDLWKYLREWDAKRTPEERKAAEERRMYLYYHTPRVVPDDEEEDEEDEVIDDDRYPKSGRSYAQRQRDAGPYWQSR